MKPREVSIKNIFSEDSFLPFKMAAALLGIYVTGLAALESDLSKLRILKLYISEIVSIVAICLLVAGWNPKSLFELLKSYWFIFPFTIWCFVVHVIPDIKWLVETGTGFDRFLRHSMIFVYPVLWTAFGMVFRSQVTKAGWVCFIAAIVALQFFSALTGQKPLNLALGPMYAFLYPVVLAAPELLPAWIGRRVILLRAAQCLLTVAMTFPLATANMVTQRTSYLNFLFSSIYGSFFTLRMKGYGFKKVVLLTGASALGIFLISWSLANLFIHEARFDRFVPKEMHDHHKVATDWKVKALGVFQHADDFTLKEGKVSLFQARYRRALWSRAYSDWMESPLIGKGFRVEVPSWVFDYENKYQEDRKLDFLAALPISGPHNFLLNLLARTGVIGLALWIYMSWRLLKPSIPFLTRSTDLTIPVVFTSLTCGFIYCFLNLGIEGPHYAIPLYFLLGALYRHVEMS